MADVEKLELAVTDSPATGDVDRLREGLKEHSRSFVDSDGFRPLAVFARDAAGELTGGAYGFVNWNWLDLSLLWVADFMKKRLEGLHSSG